MSKQQCSMCHYIKPIDKYDKKANGNYYKTCQQCKLYADLKRLKKSKNLNEIIVKLKYRQSDEELIDILDKNLIIFEQIDG